MNTITADIITDETPESILERLKKITIEEPPFIKPKKALFIGKINESNFKLITFNSPPIEIEFFVSNKDIKIKFDRNTAMPDLTAVIYALGLPISFGLFLWSMFDKHVPLGGKVFFAIFMLFPYLLNKITKSLYNSNFLPSNEDVSKKIEKLMDVKVVVMPNNKA